jgi:hypothetical protein
MFNDATRQKRNDPGLGQRKASAINKGRRRSIPLKARVDRELGVGALFVPFCFSDAATTILTNPKLDQAVKIPELRFCASRIEKRYNESQSTTNSIHYYGPGKGPSHSSTEEEDNA